MLKTSVLLTLLSSALLFSATGFCITNQNVTAPESCKAAEAIFTKTAAAKYCGYYTTGRFHMMPKVFVPNQLKVSVNYLSGLCSQNSLMLKHVTIPCNKVCSKLVDNNGHLTGC